MWPTGDLCISIYIFVCVCVCIYIYNVCPYVAIWSIGIYTPSHIYTHTDGILRLYIEKNDCKNRSYPCNLDSVDTISEIINTIKIA